MTIVTPVKELAEAICAGLYKTDFEHKGDSPNGTITKFGRGRPPKRIVVSVERRERPEDGFPSGVEVGVAWLHKNGHVKGWQRFFIDANTARSVRFDASARVLERVLNIYADVQAGVGVAGEEALAGLSFGGVQHDGNEDG